MLKVTVHYTDRDLKSVSKLDFMLKFAQIITFDVFGMSNVSLSRKFVNLSP